MGSRELWKPDMVQNYIEITNTQKHTPSRISLYNSGHHVSPTLQRIIMQMGISLGHGRALMRHKPLQSIEVNLARRCQVTGKRVPQSMARPEIIRQP
jgi:hypothetical protein